MFSISELFAIWQPLAIGVLCSFVASLFLITSKLGHLNSLKSSLLKTQSFHESPTPRIGGLAIYISLLITYGALIYLVGNISDQVIWLTFLAALPVFLGGLAEDITHKFGPTQRALGCIVSAVLAIWLMNFSITSVHISFLDSALSIPFVSMLFTVFAVSGVTNAINIIDGFHGLAAGTSIIILIALGLIALISGNTNVMLLCSLTVFSILGFFLVNFPFGKLFMGDSGAYLLGFIIGWVCVLLSESNTGVSPWACLLVCAYPISETVYSIYRRAKARVNVSNPDREHFHSLIKQVVIARMLSNWSLNSKNAAVSPVLWIFTLAPASFAVFNYSNTSVLIAASLVFFAVYIILYRLLANHYHFANKNSPVS